MNHSESVVSNNSVQDLTTEIGAYYSDFSTSDFDLQLPNRVSSPNVLRTQNYLKRSNTNNRYNFEFIKSGKIVNTGIYNFIQKKSLISYSYFTNPVHRLIRIGKLVI